MLCGVDGTKDTFWHGAYRVLGSNGVVYPVSLFLLIIAFAYFYTQITFDPIEVSNNIKKQGGTIPGIRQGRPTSDYIRKILNKVTLVGALFLGIVAVLPVIAGPHIFLYIIEWIISGGYAEGTTYIVYNNTITTIEQAASSVSSQLTFGGTSILIIVGVVIETFRGLESELTMRNYKGFL
jgi:preprotein translocase subunit SecY